MTAFIGGVAGRGAWGSLYARHMLIWALLSVGWFVAAGVLYTFHRKQGVPQSWAVLACLASACFFAGAVRFEMAIPPWNSHSIAYWEKERVSLLAVVVREPRIVARGRELIVRTERLGHPTLGVVVPLVGLVRTVVPASSDYGVGDVLMVECTLGIPKAFDGFAYDAYLASKGVFAQCTNPRIELVHASEKNIVGWLVSARHEVERRIALVLPAPESLLAQGVLVGGSGAWPADLQDAFRAAGISHIVALSGYNVTIIIVALVFALVRMYASRALRLVSIVGVLTLFLLMTGASASLMRAAVMGVLVLVALLVGRCIPWGGILLISAGILVSVNPLALLYDLGFQLSFAAMAGLICFVPRIHDAFAVLVPEKKFPWWADIAVATLCATAATAPIIAHAFGTFAPYGFLVNMIVVPLVPVLMVGACIAFCLSFFPSGLAALVGAVIQIPYTFVLLLAHTVAHLPGASWNVSALAGVVASSVFFACVFMAHAWVVRSRRATISP